ASVLGRRRHRLLNLVLADQTLHRATADEPIVQSLTHSDIGVLQINHVQPWSGPAELVTLTVSLQQPQVRRPVQSIGPPGPAAPRWSRSRYPSRNRSFAGQASRSAHSAGSRDSASRISPQSRNTSFEVSSAPTRSRYSAAFSW